MSRPQDSSEVTRLLDALQEGGEEGSGARAALYKRVYDELHALAGRHRARWHGNNTLNTTALVHEAYLKLVGGEGNYEGRAHFLAVASKAMRYVLFSYAERQTAQKRGGGTPDLSFDETVLVPPDRAEAFVSLEEALVRLERVDERAARVVECRFFGGLSVEETAEALDISSRTVARDWAVVRSWLYGELTRDPGTGSKPISLDVPN